MIGTRGSISRSTDLHHWQHFHWNGADILPGTHGLPGNVVTVNNLLSLTYHPDHKHFFVETSTGQIWVSQNGSVWGLWQDGSTVPETTYPQVSETVAAFEHDGRYLKFERANENDAVWQVFQSQDGITWSDDGQFFSSWTPEKAFYRDGTWLGMIAGTCFLNVGNSWQTESDSGYSGGFPAVFSHGRYHHNQIMGIRDGYLSEYKNGFWYPLAETQASVLQYLPKLDRFILIDYGSGVVDATYDGSEIFRLYESDDFRPEQVAEFNHYLVMVGRNSDNEPVVLSSEGPVSWETGISSDFPVNFIDGGAEVDWSSYPYPDQPRSAKITSDWEGFYLATGYNVYQSEDGLQWQKVLEADTQTASWITALFTYRGETVVATTNYTQSHRIYVPPPEGIDPQNTLYSRRYYGQDWEETIVDDQVFVSRPSLEGPYLMEYLYGFPSSTVTFAENIESIERRWAPWVATDGAIVWAYGRYYLFQGDSVAKTHFLGFKDAQFYKGKEEFGDDHFPYILNGYFGSFIMNPEGMTHHTLGNY